MSADGSRPANDVRYVVGVLAGGRSRRMGRPKALLRSADGDTLIERTVRVLHRLRPAAEQIVICGRSCPLPGSLSDLPVLTDAVPDGGPLAGLSALLDFAGARWAMLLACDMPCLETPVLARLLDHVNQDTDTDTDAVAYRRGGDAAGYHACCALYHPRAHPVVTAELETGPRSVHSVLDRIRIIGLEPSPDEVRQLENVNTPDDYGRLCEACGSQSSKARHVARKQ